MHVHTCPDLTTTKVVALHPSLERQDIDNQRVGEDDDTSKEVNGTSSICNSEQGRDKHQWETDTSMGT